MIRLCGELRNLLVCVTLFFWRKSPEQQSVMWKTVSTCLLKNKSIFSDLLRVVMSLIPDCYVNLGGLECVKFLKKESSESGISDIWGKTDLSDSPKEETVAKENIVMSTAKLLRCSPVLLGAVRKCLYVMSSLPAVLNSALPES